MSVDRPTYTLDWAGITQPMATLPTEREATGC